MSGFISRSVEGVKQPRTRRGGLFSVASRLPDSIKEEYWRREAGICSRSNGCGKGFAFAPRCDDPENSVIPGCETVCDKELSFQPFIVGYSEGCSALSPYDYASDARNGLESVLQSRVAYQMSHYSNHLFNSTLADEGVSVGSGGLVAIMGELLDQMCACGFEGQVTFHVPKGLLPWMLSSGLVEFVGTQYRMGDSLVSFDAYENSAPAFMIDNTDPANPTRVPNPDAGVVENSRFWVYATGPVEYDLSSVIIDPSDEESAYHAAGRTNIKGFTAYRQAIVRFHNCCVMAGLVDPCA